MPKELLLKNYENLKKTILLFETALKDVVQILNKENFSEQDLKSFDVFSFRFQKVVEMFLYFLRSLEIYLVIAHFIPPKHLYKTSSKFLLLLYLNSSSFK